MPCVCNFPGYPDLEYTQDGWCGALQDESRVGAVRDAAGIRGLRPATSSSPCRPHTCWHPPGAGRPPTPGTDSCPPAEAASPRWPGLEGHRLRPAAARALRGLGHGLVHGQAFGHQLPSPQTDAGSLRQGRNLLLQVRACLCFSPLCFQITSGQVMNSSSSDS